MLTLLAGPLAVLALVLLLLTLPVTARRYPPFSSGGVAGACGPPRTARAAFVAAMSSGRPRWTPPTGPHWENCSASIQTAWSIRPLDAVISLG